MTCKMKPSQDGKYLECEKLWVFLALTFVGGYFGGYTYNLRGGVFCNAQTANLVLMGLNLADGRYAKAMSYVFSFIAYFSGIILSESLAKYVKRFRIVRWDTMLIGIECLGVILLAFMPINCPDRICQVTLNFFCAMQFNTFRQAEGVGMATTFCTNHIRQFGSMLVRYLRSGNPEQRRKSFMHFSMILSFLMGVIIATIGCNIVSYRSLLGAAAVLAVVFIKLLIADRTYERNLLERVPAGH